MNNNSMFYIITYVTQCVYVYSINADTHIYLFIFKQIQIQILGKTIYIYVFIKYYSPISFITFCKT